MKRRKDGQMKYVVFTVTSLLTTAIVAFLAFVGALFLRLRLRPENEPEYIVLEGKERGATKERVPELVHV